MKLIYIKNSTDNGYFTQKFDEDILIKKGSQIGLLNAHFEFDDDMLIDTTTDKFQFRTAITRQFQSVYLPHGVYSPHILAEKIQDAMNNALVLEGSNIGVQWLCRIDKSRRKTNIRFIRNRPEALEIPTQNNQDCNSLVDNSWQATTDKNDWSAHIFTDDIINTGASFLKCRVDTLGEMIIGLIDTQHRNTYLGPDMYSYAILINGGKLWTIHHSDNANEEYDTGIDVVKGDRLYLEIYQGMVHLVKYTGPINAAHKVILREYPLNRDKHYFGAMSFYNSTAIASNVIMHRDPYTKKDADGMTLAMHNIDVHNFARYGNTNHDENIEDPYRGLIPSRFTINFELSLKLGKLLGYDNVEMTSETSCIEHKWLSENKIGVSQNVTTLLITMPNVRLNSYSSINKKHLNVLMSIFQKEVVDDDQVNSLVYETSQPVFLDTVSNYDQIWKEVSFRIVDGASGSSLNFAHDEGCHLTLLIKEPGE